MSIQMYIYIYLRLFPDSVFVDVSTRQDNRVWVVEVVGIAARLSFLAQDPALTASEGEEFLECDDEGAFLPGGDWKPGENCPFIHRFQPISQQGLGLVGNAWTNARKIPGQLLKSCLAYLPLTARHKRSSIQGSFVSAFLGISTESLRSWRQYLVDCRWRPESKQSVADWQRRQQIHMAETKTDAMEPPVEKLDGRSEDQMILERVIRRALLCCFENRTGLEYERDMESLTQICGPTLFGTACCGRDFYNQVIHVAACVVKQMDSLDLAMQVPGLGIQSDFSLMLDPVSLGFGHFARHETCLVICLASISPHNGRIRSMFFEAPTMALEGHTGENLKKLTLEALLEHPCGFALGALRGRLACVTGDGALCRGGPDAAHSSTGTCELLWQSVHPGDTNHCCTWDRGPAANQRTAESPHSGPLAYFVEKLFWRSETEQHGGKAKPN